MKELQKEIKLQKKNKAFLILSIIALVILIGITIYCAYYAYAMTIIYGMSFGYASQYDLVMALFSRVVGAIYLPLFLTTVALVCLIVSSTFVKRKKITIANLKEELGLNK